MNRRRFGLMALLAMATCIVSLPVLASSPLLGALIEVRVAAQTPAGELAVTPDTELRQGDRILMQIVPRRAAHVVVLHITPSGAASVLFATGQAPVPARKKLRLPQVGEGPYQLDNEVGHETLVVIASEVPPQTASPHYAALLRSVQEHGRLPAGGSLLEPEPTAEFATNPASTPNASRSRAATPAPGIHRAEGRTRGFEGAPTLGFPDRNGVAVVTLALKHVARRE